MAFAAHGKLKGKRQEGQWSTCVGAEIALGNRCGVMQSHSLHSAQNERLRWRAVRGRWFVTATMLAAARTEAVRHTSTREQR